MEQGKGQSLIHVRVHGAKKGSVLGPSVTSIILKVAYLAEQIHGPRHGSQLGRVLS